MLFLVRPVKGANITYSAVTMFITVFISIRIIHTVDQICHVQEGLLDNYKHQGKEGGRVISPAMMHVALYCTAIFRTPSRDVSQTS